MTPQNAMKITIQNRKPQKPTYYFSPDRKVKLGSIEKDKDIVMSGGRLMCMYYENKFSKLNN